MTPLFIRVHDRDNVAIIVAPEGATPALNTGSTFQLREFIPQSHKVALADLEAGERVYRYGEVIGYANRSIAAGTWVRQEMLDLPAPPALDQLELATAVPAPLPPLDGFTFEGYRNADGSVGTKNILGITTTVQCVAPTVDYAVHRIKSEILPRFPNVDDVAGITHNYGCGVAIDAPGAAVPINTLDISAFIQMCVVNRWSSVWAAKNFNRIGCSTTSFRFSTRQTWFDCRTSADFRR